MNREELVSSIKQKNSFLCIGLDTDIEKIPPFLLDFPDPIFEFNKAIVEATHDLCVAYKPNIAFYEAMGPEGWISLEKTMEIIPSGLFTIADAKRGDIGNSSRYYAKTFFDRFGFDAVTLSPYMGEDSVAPFLEYSDKWVILLAITSNMGSRDFQLFPGKDSGSGEQLLYQEVLKRSCSWGNDGNTMYVVGATKSTYFESIRSIVPNHFLLVPGVGAQGGSLADLVEMGMNSDCGLLVNASRSIIYASNGKDFAIKAREAALELKLEMETHLNNHQ